MNYGEIPSSYSPEFVNRIRGEMENWGRYRDGLIDLN